jgi:hypothetical protein
MPSIAEARWRLSRAGYALHAVRCGSRWVVEARGGGQTVVAVGGSIREAWLAALRAVEALRVVVPPLPESPCVVPLVEQGGQP